MASKTCSDLGLRAAICVGILLAFSSLQALELRVLLVRSVKSCEISSSSVMVLESPSDRAALNVIAKIPARISIVQDRFVIGSFGSFAPPVHFRGPGPIRLNGKSYSGSITVHLRNSTLYVVNDVDLERYLCGVVPREISPDWPAEAVKAQAVVARTFALRQRLESENNLYDLDNSTFSQMYEGSDIENSRVNAYVGQTAGEVLGFRRGLAQVYYHSTCGGLTESAEALWGKRVPYLESVTCRFCEHAPYFSWVLKLSPREIAGILKKKGFEIVPDEVRIKRWTASRRAESLIFSERSRAIEMRANDFRTLAGTKELKSLLFRVQDSGNRIVFEGHGFGHGVGMCQWGARGMAEKGLDYRRILQYYFRGTALMKTPGMTGNR